MVLDLSTDANFQLTLDPVRLGEQAEVIAFDICVAYKMPSQQTKMQVQECWLAHASLNCFESALSSLLDTDGESCAQLHDMDDRFALEVVRRNTGLLMRIQASDFTGQSRTFISQTCYLLDVERICNQLNAYPKWW